MTKKKDVQAQDPAANPFEQDRATAEVFDEAAPLAETTETLIDGAAQEPGTVVEYPADEPAHNLDECRAYIPSDLDRFGPQFTRELPVPVPEHLLAEYAQEMARIHSRWVKTKLDAKAFAKSCKEITDDCEKRELELAEVINAGEEERPVRVFWSYDFTHHVKRLVRTDINAVVEERALDPEDYQTELPLFASLDEQGAAQEIQAGDSEGDSGDSGEIASQIGSEESGENDGLEGVGEVSETDTGLEGDINEGKTTVENLDADWPSPPGAGS